MYMQLKHCKRILSEIDTLRYRDVREIREIMFLTGDTLGKETIPMDSPDLLNYIPGDSWGEDDDKYLFRADFTVPGELAGESLLLMVETTEYGETDLRNMGSKTYWNMSRNPQFLLSVNGEAYQGLDKHHTYATLTRDAVPGDKYTLALDGYPGSRLRISREGRVQLFLKIAVLDKAVDRLYFNLKVPVDIADRIDDEKTKKDILGYTEKTVNMLDLRKAYSESFYESIDDANGYLENEFYDNFCGDHQAIVSGVGHTHIDVAWLWPLDVTRMKTIHSFATVLRLMEEYPEYLFMSSQPQLYDFIKNDRPDIYEKIKDRVAAGQWEPEGGMWLEADCNLASGESFVRQLLFGTRFFEEEFDAKCKVLWLPDVFGYSAALPQILQKSGIEYFMTTKIFWNEYNRFPYETFQWEGIDGSTVLSHFITATDTRNTIRSYGSTYNGRLSTAHVKGSWDNYNQKELNNDVLMAFGYGDGGGGPTREMLEEGRRLSKAVPGCPKYEMKKSRDFFEQLDERVKDNPRLPKWVGELYLEYHRGTYTSVGKNKWFNRKSELLLRDVELFSQIASSNGLAEYPKDVINANWETVLLNQFHDILPGSSIKEVYEESQEQYEGVMESLGKLLENSITKIAYAAAEGSDKCVVFNQLTHERYEIAKVKTDAKYTHAIAADGTRTPGQTVTEEGENCFIFTAKVPPMGYTVYTLISEETETGTMVADTFNMENDFIKLTFDEAMNISSIYDKCNCRELVKEDEVANHLLAFEDKPAQWDAWDINIYYQDKKWEINDVLSAEVIESGPVRSAVKIVRPFMDSVIEQTVYMYSNNPRIDFDTHIDWKNDHILLKAAFPMDIHTSKASYDIQYGNVERPTHWNTSWDYARFEVCAHKWADISEPDFGVSMMNDCKYGHDIKDSVMRLTLLKSATMPSPVADLGEHNMKYSIMPHAGDFRTGGTVDAAYELNCPMHSVLVSGGMNILGSEMSFASVDKENVKIEAVKQAEDGKEVIIRVYECFSQRSTVTMTLAKPLKEAFECDLMEHEEESIASNGNELTFVINPYEIKTFKLKL